MDGMITKFIDNRKITPTLGWADFRGFSLLFDNPGNGFEPIGDKLERIHCDVEHTPELAFYRKIKQFIEQVYPVGMQKKMALLSTAALNLSRYRLGRVKRFQSSRFTPAFSHGSRFILQTVRSIFRQNSQHNRADIAAAALFSKCFADDL